MWQQIVSKTATDNQIPRIRQITSWPIVVVAARWGDIRSNSRAAGALLLSSSLVGEILERIDVNHGIVNSVGYIYGDALI
jgi:hypothetical protein